MKRKILTKSASVNIVCAAISIFVFLLLWQLGSSFTSGGRLVPGPIKVIGTFFTSLVGNPMGQYPLVIHALFSLGRVMAGFVLGSLVGIVLGIGMGYSPIVEAIFAPIFRIIRPIPPIAWIPISIIWFGLGESAKVFLIFISAFSNVTLNAWSGAKNIDPALIGAAKMLGANDRQIFLTVIFPGDVPSIFAGLQVAISSCWATVLAAEMVRSSEGLGWLIIAGSSNNDMVQVMVGIVCIGIVGLCLAILFRKMEEVLCRWNRSEQ